MEGREPSLSPSGLIFIYLAASAFSCGSQALEHGLNYCGSGLSSRGTWDLTSPTKDQTSVTCIAREILYHWTTREVLIALFKVREIPTWYT